jgi:hypothetical protein
MRKMTVLSGPESETYEVHSGVDCPMTTDQAERDLKHLVDNLLLASL